MDILDLDKIWVFIFFIMPGFISLKIYYLINPSKPQELSSQLVNSVMYSCITYAVHLPILFASKKLQDFNEPNFSHWLFLTSLLFIVPILVPISWLWLRNRPSFNRYIPHPVDSPWDWVFRSGKEYWIIITTIDEQKIGGKYGTGSFTSSYPEEPQIYISEQWLLNSDNGFERPINDSAGIIILANQIKNVQLFQIKISTEGDLENEEN